MYLLSVLHLHSASSEFLVAPILSSLVLPRMSMKSHHSNVHIYPHRGRSDHSHVRDNLRKGSSFVSHQFPKGGEDPQSIAHDVAAWKRPVTFLSSLYSDVSDSSSVRVPKPLHEGERKADPAYYSNVLDLRLASAEGPLP